MGATLLTADENVIIDLTPMSLSVPAVVVPSLAYRMRAYDATAATTVYWNATIIDALGAEYTGPGPLTQVVVVKVL